MFGDIICGQLNIWPKLVKTLAWQSKESRKDIKNPSCGTVFAGHIGKLVWKASSLHSRGGLFVYKTMEPKLSKLLDNIQDDNGNITLPRADLELLVARFGVDGNKTNKIETKAARWGFFLGAIIMFFGLLFIFQIFDLSF